MGRTQCAAAAQLLPGAGRRARCASAAGMCCVLACPDWVRALTRTAVWPSRRSTTAAVLQAYPFAPRQASLPTRHASHLVTAPTAQLATHHLSTCSKLVPTTQPPFPGFAADYAYLVAGLLDLAEAGGGAEWLAWAAELQRVMDGLFWDARRGGWSLFKGAEGCTHCLGAGVGQRVAGETGGLQAKEGSGRAAPSQERG